MSEKDRILKEISRVKKYHKNNFESVSFQRKLLKLKDELEREEAEQVLKESIEEDNSITGTAR